MTSMFWVKKVSLSVILLCIHSTSILSISCLPMNFSRKVSHDIYQSMDNFICKSFLVIEMKIMTCYQS